MATLSAEAVEVGGMPISHSGLELTKEVIIEYPHDFDPHQDFSRVFRRCHPAVRDGRFKTDLVPGNRYVVEFHKFTKYQIGLLHLIDLALKQSHFFGSANAGILACLQQGGHVPRDSWITCVGKLEHLWQGDSRWVMIPVFQEVKGQFDMFVSSSGDSCQVGSYVIFCRDADAVLA